MSRIWILVVVGLLAGSCGVTQPHGDSMATSIAPSTTVSSAPTITGPTNTTNGAGSTTATEAESKVEMTRDLVYHSGSAQEWFPPLLDVYAAAGGEGLPVVVIFHGGPGVVDKTHSMYSRIAADLVDRGAVVFSANWSSPISSPDTNDALAGMFREVAGASCAVSYAVEHAPEYGGDPDQLVLLGHSAGAMVASVLALRPSEQLPECSVQMRPLQVDRIVLYEGDWLFEDPYWDQWKDGIPTIRTGFTPWTWMDTEHKPAVTLVTTHGGVNELQRCGVDRTEGWYPARDPDGWFWERFERGGAVDDGCLDNREISAVLADTFAAEGFTVDSMFLDQSGHMHLAEADEQALLDATLSGLG
jgi:acetyl esterase/lipase